MRFSKSLVFSFAVLTAGCATGPSVKEGLSRNQIQEPIMSNSKPFVNCFRSRLIAKPKLQGNVVVAFLIGKDGIVGSSRVISSTANDKVFEQCLANAMKTIEFDAPKGKVMVKVTYPFRFKQSKNLALK